MNYINLFQILKPQFKRFTLSMSFWSFTNGCVVRISAQQQTQQFLIINVGKRQINIKTVPYDLGAGAQVTTPIYKYFKIFL